MNPQIKSLTDALLDALEGHYRAYLTYYTRNQIGTKLGYSDTLYKWEKNLAKSRPALKIKMLLDMLERFEDVLEPPTNQGDDPDGATEKIPSDL